MNLPADEMENLSGRQLGDYLVIRWLGSGGMADVYLAQQQSLKRHVALKILKPELAEDSQYVRRFQNEAQAAAALVQANIVQIHEVGCVEGLQFIAQEYVRGQNLKELLEREKSLSAQRTVAILRQVAAALCKAEEHGIVHRDIKPENILLSTDGAVKVADFGLARKNENTEGTQLTKIGVTMGTPLYMSPEQVEGKPVDVRTDIYSLGVTAYQMLAGKPPFDGDSPLSIALQHVKEEPAPLQAAREDVSNDLLKLIHRLLEKKPANRCKSAVQLLDELDTLPIAGGRSRVDTQSLASVVVENESSLQPRLEVTTTLALALKSKPSWRPRLLSWLPIGAAAVIGALVALPLRGGDPLVVAENGEKVSITRRDSIESQYFLAMRLNNEPAWKSVIDFAPEEEATRNERLVILRSKQQLALWYITNDRPREALPLLEDLANLDDMENELRAVGLAWQAIAYQRLDEPDKAAGILADALNLGEFLDESLFRQLDELEIELRARLK